MQEHMERAVIYGAAGLALLVYAAVIWKRGRMVKRRWEILRSQNPRTYFAFLAAYVVGGCALLAASLRAWLQ